ncbi:hypothetical protein KJ671_01990 [Patescibacteria group bacterium]|nr:hypothetical protein [Patescibacteria group bacterium]
MYKITSFIIAKINKVKKGIELPMPLPTKSGPHYMTKSMPSQLVIGQKKAMVANHEVELVIKSYSSDTVMIEGSIELEDIFADNVLHLKSELLNACFEYGEKKGAQTETGEEFTVYQVSGYTGSPELFLKKYSNKIANLLKSEKLELDEKEIEYTFSFQFKYAKDDLTIIDWDGAFLFDPKGDFEESIDLFQLASFQLLRYRILDEDLSERIQKAYKLIQLNEHKGFFAKFKTKEVSQAFKEIIRIRSQSISQFEALDRDIKLIGDWYSARIYDLLSKKFKLDIWANNVKRKLDTLEDIYTIVSENLGMSKIQVAEFVQIGVFFILQIGWFVLIILEFFYFT